MNNIDYKHPLTVGIFIFIGLVIFISGVFTIGSQQKYFQKKFNLKIIFDDVGGLQPGNNVWLSGIKVGTVKKIAFYGNTQIEITMNIEKVAQSHIYKDAKAKISTDGFIGNKIIVIYGGTYNAGFVSSGDLLISERGVATDDMLAMLQSNNKNLLEITDNFKKISRKLANGEGTIGELINDASVAKDLQSTIRNFKTASQKSQAAITNVVNFTSRLDKQDGLVNELISDTIIFRNLKETVSQLKGAASTAAAFMDTMQKAGGELNQKDNPLGMMLNDEEAAKNLKEIIVNLKTSSRKLDENLEALQHNFLLRGYFKKKEKNKSKQ